MAVPTGGHNDNVDGGGWFTWQHGNVHVGART